MVGACAVGVGSSGWRSGAIFYITGPGTMGDLGETWGRCGVGNYIYTTSSKQMFCQRHTVLYCSSICLLDVVDLPEEPPRRTPFRGRRVLLGVDRGLPDGCLLACVLAVAVPSNSSGIPDKSREFWKLDWIISISSSPTRDAMQAQIDSWLQKRSGKPWDPAAYVAFLADIGYNVAPAKAAFRAADAVGEDPVEHQHHASSGAQQQASSGASVALGASFLCLIGEILRPLLPAGPNIPPPPFLYRSHTPFACTLRAFVPSCRGLKCHVCWCWCSLISGCVALEMPICPRGEGVCVYVHGSQPPGHTVEMSI